MARKEISASDSGSVAAGKINDNFSELYNSQGGGGGGSTQGGIIGLNTEAINAIASAKKHFDTRVLPKGQYTTNSFEDCFCLAHGTDFHGDVTRYARFRDFCDGVTLIDEVVVSGDLVDLGTTQEFTDMMGVTFTRKQPLQCIGNHERWGNKNIAQIVSAMGMTNDYYVKDYPDWQIRIIVLNEFDTTLTARNTAAKWGAWTITQIQWFIDKLDETLNSSNAVYGYSVIVVRHAPENEPRTHSPLANDALSYEKADFWQRSQPWLDQYDANTFVVDKKIIEDIINAFRHGSTVSDTYSFNNNSNASITLNKTFSRNGKFICYIVGDGHIDSIGYAKKYRDQLYLECPCGVIYNTDNRGYGGEVVDLPRQTGTKSEDCFNVYGFDTINKIVRVVRVGADVNDLMQPRKYAYYEYEPTNS